MVVGTPELEAATARAEEVWFFRSKIWNWVLADLRSGKLRTISRLATYLDPPRGKFWPRRVVAHGQLPEFNFLTRDKPELRFVISRISPADLDKRLFSKGRQTWDADAIIPASRGAVCMVDLTSRSANVEPLMAWVEFLREGRMIARLEFEPPGFPDTTTNVWFFEVPPQGDAWRLRVQVRDAVRIEGVITTTARPAQE
jgi:hypothetical protein